MVFSEILEALGKLAARLCTAPRAPRIDKIRGTLFPRQADCISAAGGNEMPPERLNPLPA